MAERRGRSTVGTAIGIDVGGTKIAAGLVALGEGRLLHRLLFPTQAARGSAAVLADVLAAVEQLRARALRLQVPPRCIGIGLPELVDQHGGIASNATLGWTT